MQSNERSDNMFNKFKKKIKKEQNNQNISEFDRFLNEFIYYNYKLNCNIYDNSIVIDSEESEKVYIPNNYHLENGKIYMYDMFICDIALVGNFKYKDKISKNAFRDLSNIRKSAKKKAFFIKRKRKINKSREIYIDNVQKYDDLSIDNKVNYYLRESDTNIKTLIWFRNKLAQIKQNNADIEELEEFLEENNDIDNEQINVSLIKELIRIIKRSSNSDENAIKTAEIVNQLLNRDIPEEKVMDYMQKIINVRKYNERIEILYEYLTDELDENAIELEKLMDNLCISKIDLDRLERLNELKIMKKRIKQELDYEVVNGSYCMDVEKVNELEKQYDDINKRYYEVNKTNLLKNTNF